MFACWRWCAPRPPDDDIELVQRFTDADIAVLEMKVLRDKQQQYARYCQQRADAADELARFCLQKGSRRRAAQALRCKQERQRACATAETYVSQLDQVITGVGDAVQLQSVMNAIRLGNETLTRLTEELTAGDIAETMDQVRETLRQADASTEAFAEADDEDEELLEMVVQQTALLHTEEDWLQRLPIVAKSPLPAVVPTHREPLLEA